MSKRIKDEEVKKATRGYKIPTSNQYAGFSGGERKRKSAVPI